MEIVNLECLISISNIGTFKSEELMLDSSITVIHTGCDHHKISSNRRSEQDGDIDK